MSEKRTGCEEIRASLPELLYGEMDRDEERRVRDHLGDCPQCRRALEDYEKLRSVLRASPPIELPAGL